MTSCLFSLIVVAFVGLIAFVFKKPSDKEIKKIKMEANKILDKEMKRIKYIHSEAKKEISKFK